MLKSKLASVRTSLVLALGFFVALPSIALAEKNILEEVMVTANKRETNLMETPAAVSAFDEKSRDQMAIYNHQQIRYSI